MGSLCPTFLRQQETYFMQLKVQAQIKSGSPVDAGEYYSMAMASAVPAAESAIIIIILMAPIGLRVHYVRV
jgi:hypothetical protein